MKFNEHDLKVFSQIADNRDIVIVEGLNGIGQKFKTIGCFMPTKTAMNNYYYILEDGFALFQGQYDDKGEMQYCAFHINPNNQNVSKDCLFVDTIKTRDGRIIYKHPNFQKIRAYNLYNKLTRPNEYDYTSSRIHDTLLMHIGKPMTYKHSTGTLLSLESKNSVTFAVFSTGTKRLEGVVEPFDVHPSNNARKNLMDYSNGIENEK